MESHVDLDIFDKLSPTLEHQQKLSWYYMKYSVNITNEECKIQPKQHDHQYQNSVYC